MEQTEKIKENPFSIRLGDLRTELERKAYCKGQKESLQYFCKTTFSYFLFSGLLIKPMHEQDMWKADAGQENEKVTYIAQKSLVQF